MINVTAAIIIHNNKILSARRAKDKHLAGYWEFPGGKVESDEGLEECLKREIKEELDLDVVVGDFIGQSTHDYGDTLIRLHAFIIHVSSTVLTLNDHDKSRWLAYDELNCVTWAPADIPIVNQLKTYLFYSKNTDSYISETLDIELTNALDVFTENLQGNATLLDIGCGSGRDTLYFKSQGYHVVATDMVSDMAEAASKKIFQKVLVRSCFNLGFVNEFDGIWASACLLHCPKSEFMSALLSIASALKRGGIAYISLKQGKGEALDSLGRFFSYFTEKELIYFFDEIEELSIFNLWLDESNFRNTKQVWINLLVRKV